MADRQDASNAANITVALPTKNPPSLQLFSEADKLDFLLMFVGTLGSLGSGIAWPGGLRVVVVLPTSSSTSCDLQGVLVGWEGRIRQMIRVSHDDVVMLFAILHGNKACASSAVLPNLGQSRGIVLVHKVFSSHTSLPHSRPAVFSIIFADFSECLGQGLLDSCRKGLLPAKEG